jgi:chromosome segregation ATPase
MSDDDRILAAIADLRIDLMARLDRLQNAITAIRDDISVNFGTAEAARRANDNTRDELRALTEQVSGMLRQIQRLQTDVRHLKGEP